jgi:hypothetical protein
MLINKQSKLIKHYIKYFVVHKHIVIQIPWHILCDDFSPRITNYTFYTAKPISW